MISNILFLSFWRSLSIFLYWGVTKKWMMNPSIPSLSHTSIRTQFLKSVYISVFKCTVTNLETVWFYKTHNAEQTQNTTHVALLERHISSDSHRVPKNEWINKKLYLWIIFRLVFLHKGALIPALTSLLSATRKSSMYFCCWNKVGPWSRGSK